MRIVLNKDMKNSQKQVNTNCFFIHLYNKYSWLSYNVSSTVLGTLNWTEKNT